MANRVSELKDNVKYISESNKNEFTFSSHTDTYAIMYGMNFSIRNEGGYWQILDVEEHSGRSFWDYLTQPKPKVVPRQGWRGGRKTRKGRKGRHTRYTKR